MFAVVNAILFSEESSSDKQTNSKRPISDLLSGSGEKPKGGAVDFNGRL